jgi:hypothetical protein
MTIESRLRYVFDFLTYNSEKFYSLQELIDELYYGNYFFLNKKDLDSLVNLGLVECDDYGSYRATEKGLELNKPGFFKSLLLFFQFGLR